MYVPSFDIDEWQFGFEIEMLFGDLGLRRYQAECEAFDVAPKGYCQKIADRLSKATGESWQGLYEAPKEPGFYVVPEYDLDPIEFPATALGGVELITPPLSLDQAEELRASIIKAVDFEGGYVWPSSPINFGWHVNADKIKQDRELTSIHALAGFWEGTSELEMLFGSERYDTKSAKPQHHAYGPRLLSNLKDALFPITEADVTTFTHNHRGQNKYFATNLGKLSDRGYVELRHFGLLEFMEPHHFPLASLFGSILRSFNIAPSNSRPFDERLLRRFEILEMWLNQLVGELRVDVEEMALMRGKRGVVSFGDDVLANAIWNGTLEVSLDHDWSDQDHGGQSLSIVHGVDADDLTSCIGVLAIDAVYAGWTDSLRPLTNPYFQEQLDDLRKALWNEELFPSQELIKMGG